MEKVLLLMLKYNAIADSFEDSRAFLKEAEALRGELRIPAPAGDIDIISWLGAKIDDAEKESCDSGVRFRGR
jgi:hypothetical protein